MMLLYIVCVHRDTFWKPAFLSGTVPCNSTYLHRQTVTGLTFVQSRLIDPVRRGSDNKVWFLSYRLYRTIAHNARFNVRSYVGSRESSQGEPVKSSDAQSQWKHKFGTALGHLILENTVPFPSDR
jgi:hypothetical protein